MCTQLALFSVPVLLLCIGVSPCAVTVWRDPKIVAVLIGNVICEWPNICLQALHVEVDMQIREIGLEGEAAGIGGGDGVMSAGEVQRAVTLIAGQLRSVSSQRVHGTALRRGSFKADVV